MILGVEGDVIIQSRIRQRLIHNLILKHIIHMSMSLIVFNSRGCLHRHVGRLGERLGFQVVSWQLTSQVLSDSCTIKNTTRRIHAPHNQRLLLVRGSRRYHSLPAYKIARKQFGEDAPKEGDRISQFPWRDGFELSKSSGVDKVERGGQKVEYKASDIIDILDPLISEERKDRIRNVIDHRCFDILPVIERPHDWGNVAAVCRSADAMGFGALHIIRDASNDAYKQSTRTSGGADKWLDIQLHTVRNSNETQDCLMDFKKRGFKIVATCLGTEKKQARAPDAIDWTQPTVVIFGNELDGISKETVEMSDEICEIPIDGFVESYNISVAASLIFWEARRMRLEKRGVHGDLSVKEKNILQAIFYLRNKGQFVSYATELLRRKPPDWQMHRGDWNGKEFGEGSSLHIPNGLKTK